MIFFGAAASWHCIFSTAVRSLSSAVLWAVEGDIAEITVAKPEASKTRRNTNSAASSFSLVRPRSGGARHLPDKRLSYEVSDLEELASLGVGF